MEKAKRTSEEIRKDIKKLKAVADRLMKQAAFLREPCASLENSVSSKTSKDHKPSKPSKS